MSYGDVNISPAQVRQASVDLGALAGRGADLKQKLTALTNSFNTDGSPYGQVLKNLQDAPNGAQGVLAQFGDFISTAGNTVDVVSGNLDKTAKALKNVADGHEANDDRTAGTINGTGQDNQQPSPQQSTTGQPTAPPTVNASYRGPQATTEQARFNQPIHDPAAPGLGYPGSPTVRGTITPVDPSDADAGQVPWDKVVGPVGPVGTPSTQGGITPPTADHSAQVPFGEPVGPVGPVAPSTQGGVGPGATAPPTQGGVTPPTS